MQSNMRLLIDANITYRLIEALRKNGHDVRSVLEESPNADDEKILRSAVRQKRIVVTYDKDFGELIFKLHKRHNGVILLRANDESYLTQFEIIKKFFSQHSPKEIRSYFWVLTDRLTRRAKIE